MAESLALETQLSGSARADEGFLRTRLKTRFVGLEALPDGTDLTGRWCVTILGYWRPPRPGEEAGLRKNHWIGRTPEEALAGARAEIEQRLARKGAR